MSHGVAPRGYRNGDTAHKSGTGFELEEQSVIDQTGERG